MNFLKTLGINANNYGASTGLKWLSTCGNGQFDISSPADGKAIASVYQCSKQDYEDVITTAQDAFKVWRKVPAPNRGDIVRQIGNKLRDYLVNLMGRHYILSALCIVCMINIILLASLVLFQRLTFPLPFGHGMQ